MKVIGTVKLQQANPARGRTCLHVLCLKKQLYSMLNICLLAPHPVLGEIDLFTVHHFFQEKGQATNREFQSWEPH